MAGRSFTLEITVRTRGSGPSDSTQLIYYQSADSAITRDDTEVGAVQVSGLDASGSSTESVRLTAPSKTGTYYYGACVEPVSGESDRTNYCSDGVAVTVTPPPSDLIVHTAMVDNVSPKAGQSFTLEVTVRNRGIGPSDSTQLIYYQSTDSTVTPDDTEVGAVQVSGLDAPGSSTQSVRRAAPSKTGTYYYGACVEPGSGESDSTNNSSNGVAVTVPPPPPDLVADTPIVGDGSPMAGQSFTLDVTVRNRGSGPSDSTKLSYYRSTDGTITHGDSEIGTDTVSGLNPNESGHQSILTYAPSTPGSYYYGACIDPATGESDTTNNCSNGVAVTVSAFRMDNLPWVRAGITSSERRAMDHIRALARVDQSMSQRVAGSPWLSDGVAEDELHTIGDLRSLADRHPEIAVQVTTVPDNTSYLIGAALLSLQSILSSDPDRSQQLLSQPWFQDGLTAEEAALIATLRSAAVSEKAFADLIRGGHVRSETITLPLADEVSLFAVGRSEPGLDDALERMMVGVTSIEGFMGTPWPNPVVILLQELVLDLRADPTGPVVGGWYAGDHVVVRNTSKSITYHELGHYYLHGGIGPQWLFEGGADFLAAFTLRSTGHPYSINSTYFRLQAGIADRCAPGGAFDVQS